MQGVEAEGDDVAGAHVGGEPAPAEPVQDFFGVLAEPAFGAVAVDVAGAVGRAQLGEAVEAVRRLADDQRALRNRNVPEGDPYRVHALAAAAHVHHVHVRAGELLVAHRPQPLVAEGRRRLGVEAAVERLQFRSFEHPQHFRAMGNPLPHADAAAAARHHALRERRACGQCAALLQILEDDAARLQHGAAVDQPADEQVAVGRDAPPQLPGIGQRAGAVPQIAELRRGERHLLTLKLNPHRYHGSPDTITLPQ